MKQVFLHYNGEKLGNVTREEHLIQMLRLGDWVYRQWEQDGNLFVDVLCSKERNAPHV